VPGRQAPVEAGREAAEAVADVAIDERPEGRRRRRHPLGTGLHGRDATSPPPRCPSVSRAHGGGRPPTYHGPRVGSLQMGDPGAAATGPTRDRDRLVGWSIAWSISLLGTTTLPVTTFAPASRSRHLAGSGCGPAAPPSPTAGERSSLCGSARGGSPPTASRPATSAPTSSGPTPAAPRKRAWSTTTSRSTACASSGRRGGSDLPGAGAGVPPHRRSGGLFNEHVDLVVDGVREERPRTPWST
jgi:hypothetical protein